MPEELFNKIRCGIPRRLKICFVTAFVVGLIAHIYKLTNWLPNWDSLVFRYDPQNMVAMGRWFLPVVCAPSSFYDLPWLAGLMAILLHALGASCICRMFKVQKDVTAMLIGAAVISFPSVTSVLTYNYVADGYAAAFLLSALAAMLLVEERPRYAASVACIVLSAGIYQAYITVTVMLLLCYLIREALFEDAKAKQIIVKTFKFLATGIVGMALYYIAMILILKITDTKPLEYQGMSDALSLSGFNLLGILYTIKHSFTDYFFDFSNGFSFFVLLNCIIFLLTVVLYVADAIRKRTSPIKLLMVCVYVVLLPFGASILAFINSNVDYHNLMKMGFFVFYLFLILQYEGADFKMPRLNAFKAWAILGVLCLFVFNNIVIANVSYHKLNMAYEKSYGVLVRIADRIEQTEGTDECDSILVLGALENSEAYSVNLPPDMTGISDGYIIRADDEIVGQSVFCSVLNDYCGKNYSFLYGEEKAALLEKIDEQAMGVWPEDGSVLVADGVIVIRLGKEVQ